MLEIRHTLPRLERVIVHDARGLEDYRDAQLMHLREVEALGHELRTREPHLYESDHRARVSPSDVALLAYTSGTTGSPKAAMISHRNLLAMAASVMRGDPMHETDDIVSFLPFAWVGEQLMSVALGAARRSDGEFSRKARNDARWISARSGRI